MTDNIRVIKENVGERINLYPESSDESVDNIQIHRKMRLKNKKKRKSTHVSTCDIESSASSSEAEEFPTQQRKMVPNKPNKHKSMLKDDMFEMFTNPDKKIDDQSVDEQSEDADDRPYSPDQHDPHETYDEDIESVDEDTPSPGYNTIDEEKQDLLYKFYRLQSKGVPLPHKFNMHSNVHEMRREFQRIKRDAEVNASIKFSRRMLMACVTGIEFLNKRYDPFDIKLDGWSESVMENVEDYDNTFERLHDKYKSKVQMAPEIELLLSLAGSAFMFHLTNSMFNSLPNFKDIAKQNPDIINNLMKSMGTAAASMSQPPSSQTSPSTNGNMHGAREMKPPMFDISSIMGMMQPPQPEMPVPVQNFKFVSNETFTTPMPSRTTDISLPPRIVPIMTKDSDSISEVSSVSISELSNDDDRQLTTKTISLSESTKSKGRRNRKLNSTPQNTISI